MLTFHIQDERLKELFRKSIHFCTALIPLLLPEFKTFVVCALIVAALLYSLSEYLRLSGHAIPLVTAVTENAARIRDGHKFVMGPVTLCIGVILTICAFDTTSANMGIFALAFGDGIASLIGKLFGKNKIPFTHGKTVEGSTACFCAVFLAAFAMFHNPQKALIIAAAAVVIEVFPLKDFDNLLIPCAIACLTVALQ